MDKESSHWLWMNLWTTGDSGSAQKPCRCGTWGHGLAGTWQCWAPRSQRPFPTLMTPWPPKPADRAEPSCEATKFLLQHPLPNCLGWPKRGWEWTQGTWNHRWTEWPRSRGEPGCVLCDRALAWLLLIPSGFLPAVLHNKRTLWFHSNPHWHTLHPLHWE